MGIRSFIALFCYNILSLENLVNYSLHRYSDLWKTRQYHKVAISGRHYSTSNSTHYNVQISKEDYNNDINVEYLTFLSIVKHMGNQSYYYEMSMLFVKHLNVYDCKYDY